MADGDMRRAATQVFRFADVDSLAAAYDTSDSEFVRLSAGTFTAVLTQIDLGAFRVRLANFGAATGDVHPKRPLGLVRGGWRAGRAALFVPIGEATGSMANGHAWATLGAALLSPGGEIHNLAIARHQDWGAVDFDVDVLAALLDDFGLPSLGASAASSVTVWQHGGFAALKVAIRDAARDATSFPLGFIPQGMLSALREGVMDALLSGLAALKAHESGLPRRTQEGLRIVKAADQMLCDDPARPIYTEALCEALAVSPSKLFKAFMATHGVGPHHFLKCRRLSLVRRALRVAAPEYGSVKCAALSYGFANMGRFADDYRALFGELPSQTLACSMR